jgi:hypothetical protein
MEIVMNIPEIVVAPAVTVVDPRLPAYTSRF